MNAALAALLKTLGDRHGRTILAAENADEGTLHDNCFGVLSESFHLIALEGLAAYLERRVYARELAQSATTFLHDPSVPNIVKFQSQLFARYRPLFGQVFPVRFPGKDLIPLYLKKYLQILDEFNQFSLLERDKRNAPEAERILFEAMTFLVNNWTPVVAHLKPSQNVPDGPEVIPLSKDGPPVSKIRTVSHQVKEGLYFVPEVGQPLCLYPFLHNENGHSFVLRMLTKEGAFYRGIDEPGYRLLLSPSLLIEFGEILFRQGAYDDALAFYRLGGSQNREVLIFASALTHCINSVQLNKEGEYLRAAAELELALAVRPDLPVLYHELARSYEAGNSLQQAAAVINKLLERFPVSDEGYVTLGDIFAAKGDWARANRAYEKSLSINPYHPGVMAKRTILRGKAEAKPAGIERPEPPSDDLLENLNSVIALKQREPLVGRSEELNILIEILTCRDKKNAIIVGDSGVGKTSLVEELVQRVLTGEVPASLRGRKFFLLIAGSLIAGARFRGQFEERVLEVVKKIKEQGEILVVENIHQLVSSGSSRGSALDSSSLIKPFLAKGTITVIGTTDPEAYSNIREKDPAFLKFFHTMNLEELPQDVVREIISSRKKAYEDFHGVTVPDGLFEGCVELVKMSVGDRMLPESALDLMDRACASCALSSSVGRSPATVTESDILETLSEMSGISYERLSRLTPERLASLEQNLAESVVGQDDAISKVSRVVRACKLGYDLHPYRPDGVLLFVGPTGVGKTELAKTLAKVLFGDEDKLIRIDMSEYMERISTSRLIGTSPGYVGYYDPNQLTDKIRKNPYSVMLFDEIEKADPQVLNLFLQIFDAGRLTDGRGRTVRFNHATVIMTSNLGTDVFTRSKVGFQSRNIMTDEKAQIMKEVRQFFTPEFLNRIDEIVVFNPLSQGDVIRIIDLELEELLRKLANEGKDLRLSPGAREYLAEAGYSYEYGARNLARVIRREVAEPLAMKALDPLWHEKGVVFVERSGGGLSISLLDREENENELSQNGAGSDEKESDER
ncbi:MAG TPA: AAA family ATPase [Acidobacteriota bacterium]|nr:AAA family ATPase [Acidobacteriota bacterium]HNT16748.1 AAA family ATPase [Acidobacteriota bacterium]